MLRRFLSKKISILSKPKIGFFFGIICFLDMKMIEYR